MYQPFYIEAFKTGLELDKPSFKIEDDAFEILEDAYVWRERVIKKKGYEKKCRLTRTPTVSSLGNTTGSTSSGNIKTFLSLETNMELAQNTIVIHIAAPNAEIFTEPSTADGTLVGSGGGTGTINYVTGAYTLVSGSGWGAGHAITINFSYYPGLPCVGLGVRELASINAEQSYAFDTKYFYLWSNTVQNFMEAGVGTTWLGSDSDFFHGANYYSSSVGGDIFFVTNFNKGLTPDPIRYYNSTFTTFNPDVDGIGNKLQQALLLIPYKGRLIALNVYEGSSLATATQIGGRARWSWNGDALVAGSWRSDIAGKGGYIDAPTSEYIISAGFIKDTLIVGFERSVFRLRYTANEILPFVWERISNEYGIESTDSVIKLDQNQIAIAANGIIMSDGLGVKRIDQKIPDLAFQINNDNEGNKRVHGIRDDVNKLIYWTYTDASLGSSFPNRILVFNFENYSWAIFKDTLTCFSYLQRSSDYTWLDYFNHTWENCNFPWNSFKQQSLVQTVIAGNQQGYIFQMQVKNYNDSSLAIKSITPGLSVILTIVNHNFNNSDFIYVTGIIGTCNVLNDKTYRISVIDVNNIRISSIFGLPPTVPIGSTYLGGGEVSTVHDFKVRTKSFNLAQMGKGLEFGYLDFLLDRTENGEFNVDLYLDNNDSYKINVNDSFFNTTVSSTISDQDLPAEKKVMHRFFCHANTHFVQFEFNLTQNQKSDRSISSSDIQIHSLTLWMDKSGRMV
jgi:hypothetical protein